MKLKRNDHNYGKYINSPEFKKFTAYVFVTRLANLITRTDFDTKLKSIDHKNNSNKTKHLLVENELKN